MKKDILVIRESIGRIVSMLTEQSVQVTMRGTHAYVSYHPVTGAITGMNIPYIPDDATDEFISAIQGFLDHEVGHILHSCPETLIEANKEGKRIANLANIIEDVYIERKMTEGFRGSGTNLESVMKFYLNKIALPKITAALASGDIEAARGYATVAAFRAWGGQTTAMDFISQPVVAELVKPVADKLGPDLLAQLSLCNSSQDCLILARKCKAVLEKAEPPPPPPPPPSPPEHEMLDLMDSEHDLPDALESEPIDPGETKVEDDDSGKSGSDEADKVDAEETKSGKDGSKKSGDKEPGEPDDENADKEPSVDADESDTSEDTSEDTASSDDASKDSTKDVEGKSADTTEPGDTDTTEPDATDPLADMFDTERSFDDDISEELSKDAGKIINKSAYAIFSSEWDVVAPAPLCASKSTVATMEDSVRDKLGVMQKQLERGIAAQARKSWNPGQRSGRIAPGGLYKTSVGDDRVFRRRHETKAKNTAVSLVVDCSGSMNGNRIEVAATAAYALSSVLERLRVTHEVIGFTSKHSGEMSEMMRQDNEHRASSGEPLVRWNRIEPLYMPVFKPFSGKLDAKARSRLAHLLEDPMWLRQNIDGECVQIAARRLVQQRADRHIMIVLSDGEPAAAVSRGLSGHLKKTVAGLEKQGVEVIGIGIQSHSVSDYYSKSVVISDTGELPTRVMSELTKLLLAA